jgi:hypothetical protein
MKLSNIELRFINDVNIIADLCNCRMIYCDPITRSITIEGNTDNEQKCSIALSRHFKNSPEIKELKEIEIFLDNAPKIV